METIITPASQYTPDENKMVRDVNVSFDKRETESIVHIIQYDEVLPVIAVHLWNNSSPYNIPDGAAVNVRLCKADKTYVYNPSLGVSEDRNTVYIEVTAQMAAADGLAMAIVEVVNSGIAGTGVFVLDVGKNPVPDDVIQSTDEYKALYEYARETEELARAAADSERLAGEHESAAKQHMTAAGESADSANQSAQKAGEYESAAEGYKDEASTTLEEVTALAEQVSNDAASVSADATRAEKAAEEAQRVSQGSVGYYATPEALRKAHAAAEDGNWAIVGTTDTIWVWDSDTEDWTDSGNKTDLSQYYTKAETDQLIISSKNVLLDEVTIAQQMADGIYEGVNLTVRHAAEIADYSDPWAWVRARIKAKDYRGIHIGDYIPFTCTNQVELNAEVAGINTYRGYGDQETPEHIDFISREVWPTLHVMNKVAFNNGISDTVKEPWLASDLHHWINSLAGNVPNGSAVGGTPLDEVDYTADGIWHFLPADLQEAINASQPKRMAFPQRYSASGVLASDNGLAWGEMGKLWIPSEFEVYGTVVWGTAGFSAGGFQQYPIFANNMKRMKRYGNYRVYWWLLSASGFDSANFASVSSGGDAARFAANNTGLRVPVCFRLTA